MLQEIADLNFDINILFTNGDNKNTSKNDRCFDIHRSWLMPISEINV